MSIPSRFRGSTRWTVAAGLVVFLAATLCWLAPLLPHFGSGVVGEQNDSTNALRAYWVMEEAGKTPFTWSRDELNGAPEGIPRPTAPEIVSPVQSGFVWAVKPLVGRIAALNLFILLGFVLTGLSAFLLLNRFAFGLLASLFGGYVVAFNSWTFERAYLGHPAFLHGWVLVLLFFTLVRLHERRTIERAAVAGAAYGLTFSMAAYLGFIATAIVLAFAVVDLVPASSIAYRLRTLSLLAIGALVTSLFLLPGAIAFFLHRSTVVRALTNPLDQLDRLGASVPDYLIPSPRHPFLGHVASELRGEPVPERIVYFGLLTLVLAVIGVAQTRRARGRARELVLLASVTAPIALLASLPRSFQLFGIEILTPAALIGELTSFYRVYARFGYVFGIAVAILAAWALAQLPRTFRGQAIGVLAFAVVAFELLTGSVDVFRVDAAPEHDRWLSRQARGIVAHYPTPMDKAQALHLAHTEITFQPVSRQPLYTIFSAGTGGTREDGIRILSRRVNNPNTPGILAAENVRYVVLHDDVYRSQDEKPPKLRTRWLRRAYRPLARFGPVRIFELRAQPVDVDAALERYAESIAPLQGLLPASLEFTALGFNDPEEYRPSESWRWMTQAGQLRLSNPNAAPARFVIKGLSFSNRVLRRVQLTSDSGEVLAEAELPPYMVKLELGPFTIPEGESLVSLRVSPKPVPLVDPGSGLENIDKRVGSIYLSPLRIATLPDFSNSLRSG
jgi:hypothetical protein